MSSDPWRHRSEKMRCASCMWYAPKEKAEAARGEAIEREYRPELGRCRRHAPSMSGFPVVTPADWCGDHKLDENRV